MMSPLLYFYAPWIIPALAGYSLAVSWVEQLP